MLWISVIGLLVNFVYSVGFLCWKEATPGKLAVGLRVRRRETSGTMAWSTILVRWLTKNVAGFFGLVPVVGVIASIYPLIDCAWPLWDDRRQALHDKTAKTNVVLRRRGPG